MVSDTAEVFAGSFTQQEPIPEEAIDAAVAVMRHGRLHRYNTAPGETAEADEENLGHQQKFRDSVVVISGSERPE